MMPAELRVNDFQRIYSFLPVLSKILEMNYFLSVAPFWLKPVSLIIEGIQIPLFGNHDQVFYVSINIKFLDVTRYEFIMKKTLEFHENFTELF